VFSSCSCIDLRSLHSFPTRRSSDLLDPSRVAERLEYLRQILGDGPASAVAEWGHVRLFSQWSELTDPAARRLLEPTGWVAPTKRSEEHTSELQSRFDLVCRLLLEKK